MQPGRELDALIAERVMGMPKPVFKTEHGIDSSSQEPYSKGVSTLSGKAPGKVPHYSTDIAAAHDVEQRLEEKFQIVVSGWRDGQYFCELYLSSDKMDGGPHPDYFAEGETKAHAICLAALKAVEGK